MMSVSRFNTFTTDEGRYRLLVDAIIDYGIYMLDVSGRITSWNRGAQRFKGYEASEVLGKHYALFHTPQDRHDGLPYTALEIAAREGTFESEGWRLRNDGSCFWAHVVINPIHDQSGVLIGFAKITRDISHRRHPPSGFQRNQTPPKRLVPDGTDCTVYFLDRSGHVSGWNTNAQYIDEYPADMVIGRHFSLFYTEEDQKKGDPERSLATVVREGRDTVERWCVRRDGSRFLGRVVISSICDDVGSVIGFTKVTRDITDAKEAQVRRKHEREAQYQSRRIEAIGQLTGGVAHDFNNILMAVLGGLEIVDNRLPLDPNTTPFLKNAMQAAQRGKMLTQRMLAFARRQELRPETIDLSAVVQAMTDLLQRSVAPSIVIEAQFPAGLEAVHVDPNQLELVILNLVINAGDAMPHGGTVIITAGEDIIIKRRKGFVNPGRYVCLSVTDKGDGMDETTLSRAIEPFFTTKDFGQGAGLGLSMAHGFAEQSGGHFVLRSRPNEGTTAELWLPVAAGSGKTYGDMIENAAIDRRHGNTGHPQPLVVLAVDDDRLALMNTTSALNSLGYRVFAAACAEQALALMRREPMIDLVIIDHAMSMSTEATLAEVIRRDWPAIPVVFDTTLVDTVLRKRPNPVCAGERAQRLGRVVQAT